MSLALGMFLIFGTFIANLLFSLVGFWYISLEYRKRFAELADIMEDALKHRDATIGGLKAILVKSLMTDTALFDSFTEEESIIAGMDGEDENDQNDAG